MAIKHAFTSPKDDGEDPTLIRPSDWNADHEIVNKFPFIYSAYCVNGGAYETIPRIICTETNSSALSTGALRLMAIWLPKGLVITSISLWSATTALATGSNQWFALYDKDFNLCRQTVDDTNVAWAANTKKTLNLTSSFTTTYAGLYYIGAMVKATTVPTLKGNTARTGGQLELASPVLAGNSNTGLTDTAPNPCTAPSAVVTWTFWACVNTA